MVASQKKSIAEHNPKWSQIPGSGSGKINALLKEQKDQLKRQNINMSIKNGKTMIWKIWKIHRILLNIQTICRMSMELLESTTHIENVMYQ